MAISTITYLSDYTDVQPAISSVAYNILSSVEVCKKDEDSTYYDGLQDSTNLREISSEDGVKQSSIRKMMDSIAELCSFAEDGRPLNLGIDGQTLLDMYMVMSAAAALGYYALTSPEPSGPCKYNPSDNPYWCEAIQGYCQFHTPPYNSTHCPIYNGFLNSPFEASPSEQQNSK